MANTTNQGWSKPTVGGSEDTWGATINTTLDAIDTLVGPVTAAEIAKLDGLTSSTAELNKLTGVTSTPAELNKLTGVTATPAELNLVAGLTASTAELDHVTGVTSAIQTQINNKQSVDATLTALAGLATGANKVPYSTGVDTFGQLDFKDEDNMVSDSATAVPSQQSVKAYVDAVAPIGVGQTWQDMSASRAVGASYRNTTGRPIMVSICTQNTNRLNFQVSTDNSTWVTVGALAGFGNLGDEKSSQIIVPDTHYYKATGGTLRIWAELR